MAEEEGDILIGTESKLVRAKHTFSADNGICLVWLDRYEEGIGFSPHVPVQDDLAIMYDPFPLVNYCRYTEKNSEEQNKNY